MGFYEALHIVCDLAETLLSKDTVLAERQAKAIYVIREFSFGYFPGSREKRAAIIAKLNAKQPAGLKFDT